MLCGAQGRDGQSTNCWRCVHLHHTQSSVNTFTMNAVHSFQARFEHHATYHTGIIQCIRNAFIIINRILFNECRSRNVTTLELFVYPV